MYDEDRLEEELASRPILGGLWRPDGWSAPPEQAPPVKVEFTTPEFNPPHEPPALVVMDPYNVVLDALRALYLVACECPDLARWCEGTLDQAADAIKFADECKRPGR